MTRAPDVPIAANYTEILVNEVIGGISQGPRRLPKADFLGTLAYATTVSYASRALLYADLVPAADTIAMVVHDPIVGNDGLYKKVGATLTGSWTQLIDFIPGTQVVVATDVGAGLPNAIEATTSLAVSTTGNQLILLNVYVTNTSTPVTVRFNGAGTVYTIKTASGQNPANATLPAKVIGLISGTNFNIFSDISSAAIQAAAAASAAAALVSEVAAQKSALISGYYPAAQTNLPRGIPIVTITNGGTGGTNATNVSATFAGGNFAVNPTILFDVVGGVASNVRSTAGLYVGAAPAAPTITWPGVGAGFASTAPVDFLVAAGKYYLTEDLVDATLFTLYYRSASVPVISSPLQQISKVSYQDLLGALLIGPINPVASGTALVGTSYYYWPLAKTSYGKYLTYVETGSSAVNSLEIIIVKVNGDGTLDFISTRTISALSGANIKTTMNVYVPPDHIVGIKRLSGGLFYTAGTIPNGESVWYTAALPTTSTAKSTSTANGINVRFGFENEVLYKARNAFTTVNTLTPVVGSTRSIGWASPIVATGSNPVATYTNILQTVLAAEDRMARLTVGVATAATLKVLVVSMSALNATIVTSTDVAVVAGVNVIELDITGLAGYYLGIQGSVKYQANTNPEAIAVWFSSTAISTSSPVVSSTSHRFEIQMEIKTGLVADANRALKESGSNTGLKLLDAADATGVVDALTLFNSAAASHAYPYVRPGNFTLSAIPDNESGFYGPGKITAAGVRYFIPHRPSNLSMLKMVQQSLMEHAVDNNVIGVVGDSISHFYAASDGPFHWFDMFSRFVNFGIATGIPIMTALRPSSTYVPSFYGVTTTGVITTGTNGPLTESMILPVGGTLSFTGAYEQIDVFYIQQAGAGTLDFSFNAGASFKTVNAANAVTDLDKFSGPTLTGQNVSGTYTITASIAAVEITGLVRLGIKTALRTRFRTARFAHGSYLFSSFNAAAYASMLKQAAYAGGKLVPIIALGTNDMFTVPPASIVTYATAMIDAFVAGGVPIMYAIVPPRPSSAWDASFTGGRTYDAAMGPLRKLYRQRGINIIPIEGVDFVDLGETADGLHPINSGNDDYAQVLIEYFALKGSQ